MIEVRAELADEMEQELAAGLSEREIAEFVEDQEVEAGDQLGGPALPFGAGLGIELVHQVPSWQICSANRLPGNGRH